MFLILHASSAFIIVLFFTWAQIQPSKILSLRKSTAMKIGCDTCLYFHLSTSQLQTTTTTTKPTHTDKSK